MNLLDNEFEFMIQAKQPLSEIMRMPYWKFEQFIERLNKKNEQAAAEQKKQNEQIEAQQASSGLNMGKYNPRNILNGFKVPSYK